jgi:TolB-like protein/Flp pilus assembly protein TadD
MSFFNELKRRNVFRVGIAYLVVAWLVMQVADVVINNIGAPGWVFQVILLILGIGFPIALIFAWAFEMTPDGIKKEKDVDRSQSIRKETGRKLNYATIGILALAAGYFFWESRIDREPASDSVDAAKSTVAEAVTEVPAPDTTTTNNNSVAVLPFVNMSSDPEQEYFSDGITEEIINALVKIPGLSVPARTSVFGFKGHQGDVRQIGQQLNVAYILEGSIRSQANQVRITAQLIKVDDGFHLWSETYDRKLDNIFVVQEEIAASISKVLVGALDVGVATVPNKTVNMEAYDTYLNGRVLLREREMETAVEVLQRAAELDPSFAPAWAALALAYQIRGYYIFSGPEDQEKAKETARHALSLDPNNVDALAALASAMRDTWHWAEAEEIFDKALSIDPQSSELLEDVSEFYCAVGRKDDCVEVAGRGHELDPNFIPLKRNYADVLVMTGAYEEAFELFKQEWPEGFSLQPKEIGPVSIMGDSTAMALLSDDVDSAVRLMKEYQPSEAFQPVRTAGLNLLAGTADKEDLDALKALGYSNYINIGWYVFSIEGFMLAYAGETDYMIDVAIGMANRDRWGHLFAIWYPSFSNIRANPRFQELLEVYKLPEYWDKKGWPEYCQRVDAERIQCE